MPSQHRADASSLSHRGLEDRSKLADGSDAGKATVRYAHLDIVRSAATRVPH
jgi:hypothetical protein